MILVTGGSGYLGSLTAKFLINKGYKVRIATRNKNLVVFNIHLFLEHLNDRTHKVLDG